MLEQSLAMQSEESCTFSPKIYTSNKHHAHLDNRPVSCLDIPDFLNYHNDPVIANFRFIYG